MWETIHRQLTEETTEKHGHIRFSRTCLVNCFRGIAGRAGTLWCVYEEAKSVAGHQIGDPIVYIVAHHVNRHGQELKVDTKTELDGIEAVSCPKSYLALAPSEIHGGNMDWRRRVIDYHNQTASTRLARKEPKHGHLMAVA